jgi:hypothetical protein
MEQPEFSAMLMKMTGEPPATETIAHQQLWLFDDE